MFYLNFHFTQDEITKVLNTCREIGAQRFIANEYLTFYKVKSARAILNLI